RHCPPSSVPTITLPIRIVHSFFLKSYGYHPDLHSFPTRRSSDLNIRRRITIPLTLSNLKLLRRITRTENILHRNLRLLRVSGIEIGRAVQQECRDRSRMPSSA